MRTAVGRLLKRWPDTGSGHLLHPEACKGPLTDESTT
jgi:hypothetical protein